MLVTAPGGSGKSTLLTAWRERIAAAGTEPVWLQLTPMHADPRAFIDDLSAEFERIWPTEDDGEPFAAALRRQLPQLDRADPDRLATELANGLRDLAEPVVLFLDDYHQLPRRSVVDRLVGRLLRLGVPELHLAIATRGARPEAAAGLLIDGRGLEIGPEDLSLRADQIQSVLADRGIDMSEEHLSLLLARTDGWATGVLLAARALARDREVDVPRFIAGLSHREDLFEYVAAELIAEEREEMTTLLERAALIGHAARDALQDFAGPRGSVLVVEALDRGLLLADGDRLGLHQLWQDFLRTRLRRRLDGRTLREWVDRAAGLLEASGEPQRAVELCVDFAQPSTGVALLERHGLDWIERGRVDAVSRWLEALAPIADANDRDSPDLALVRALIDGRRDAARAVDALEEAADRFRERGDLDRELAARHNALILAANENLDDRARRAAIRIVRPRRLIASRDARATAMLFMGLGALLGGRYRFARRMLEGVASHDFPPRERGGLAIARSQVAFASGEWRTAIALTETCLTDPTQREHGAAYFGLQSVRAFARGVVAHDPSDWIERLAESNEAFRDFRLTVSEAEGRVFSALLQARAGRPADALEQLARARFLYDAVRYGEGRANLASVSARAHRNLGDDEAARDQALLALRLHSGSRELARRPWSGALAAHAAAELGEIEAARSFVRRHARILDTPNLAGSHHACSVALARIAELAGDEAACLTHLERAHRAAAHLEAPLPDVDGDLLSWWAAAASRRGLTVDHAIRLDPGATTAGATSGVPALNIHSLGGFFAERDGERLDGRAWRGANAQRLLQRLLVAGGRPVSRERLGTEFWPDAPAGKARGSLRAALMRLRGALEPDRATGAPDRWLRVDGEQLSVRDEALEAWDVHLWKKRLDEAERADGHAALELQLGAVRAYAGPFLPDTFEDWALDVRRDLEARFTRLGHATLRTLLEHERHAEASDVAEHLLEFDRADEVAWCARLEAERAIGSVASARRTAVEAVEAIRRELDAEPGPALRAVLDSLRHDA